MNWNALDYWKSGEWQVIDEKLKEIRKKGVLVNPVRSSLFAAMDATPFDKVKVAIIGQDPYPDPEFATGIAFSIPATSKTFPATLVNIFKEYHNDLHYPVPTCGDLRKWTMQGVFLWNAIPSCEAWRSMSHDWEEWTFLTKEIVQKLNERAVVFAFLGGIARSYVQYTDDRSDVIETSHPSPRGSLNSNVPFNGSRLFTTINAKLALTHSGAIDWRL